MGSIERTAADEQSTYFGTYVAKAQGQDLLNALSVAAQELATVLERVPTDREGFRYAEGKWSIKEVVQHVFDTDRIFCYRALCFARNEHAELPGFDENTYAAYSGADERTLPSILSEYKVVHAATLALFSSFRPEDLLRIGTANGSRISVRALGWTIAGHCMHHVSILQERYM